MQFEDSSLAEALMSGLSAGDAATKAKAENIDLEWCIADARRHFFEQEPFGSVGKTWEELEKRHIDYVRLYVKTSVEQPHTFADALEPNGVEDIDTAQMIVRLESLARPMADFGCTLKQLQAAREEDDVDFLTGFCDVWNDKRDLWPAFSTLLSEVVDELDRDDWADVLRDRLGLAHYSPMDSPEPVVLCKYSVATVNREAKTRFPITMPTVLDSVPWEHYFPAPKSMQYGRAMALTPCDGDETLIVEFLNSRVTYSHENIWKIGQIVTPAPTFDIGKLRELHLLALQIASGDHEFGT